MCIRIVVGFDRFEISNDSLGGLFPIRAIGRGAWKLVIILLDSDELYDLDSDKGELKNLISDPTFSGIRNELHDELLAWMYAHRDPFRSPAWESHGAIAGRTDVGGSFATYPMMVITRQHAITSLVEKLRQINEVSSHA